MEINNHRLSFSRSDILITWGSKHIYRRVYWGKFKMPLMKKEKLGYLMVKGIVIRSVVMLKFLERVEEKIRRV